MTATPKLVRCPFCRNRKRLDPPCCTGHYVALATDRRGLLCTGRVKGRHKPHLSPLARRVWNVSLLIHRALDALGNRIEMTKALPLAIRMVRRLRREKARQKYAQQKLSRRINWRLA